MKSTFTLFIIIMRCSLQTSDKDDSLDLPEVGCTALTFLAKRQGHTEVFVTYQGKNVLLQASLTVAAYNPLTVQSYIIIDCIVK